MSVKRAHCCAFPDPIQVLEGFIVSGESYDPSLLEECTDKQLVELFLRLVATHQAGVKGAMEWLTYERIERICQPNVTPQLAALARTILSSDGI